MKKNDFSKTENNINILDTNMSDDITTFKKAFIESDIEIIPLNFKGFINKDGKFDKKVGFPKGWKKYTNKDYIENGDMFCSRLNSGIAIKTGKINNISIVDIDTKDEDIIKKILEYLEMESLQETTCIETNKGYHLYFHYNEELKTTSNLRPDIFGEGSIDIRNDGAIIYAPPTKYSCNEFEGEYKFTGDLDLDSFIEELLGGGLIEELSEKFLECQKKSIKIDKKITDFSPPISPPSSEKSEEDDDFVNIEKPKEEKKEEKKELTLFEFEKLKKTVMNLSDKRATNYDDWVKVGMAIKNETLGKYTNEGRNLWIEFSKKCNEKFDENSCLEKWYSFNEDGSLTMGSIVHWLKEDNPIIYEKLEDDNNKIYEKIYFSTLSEVGKTKTGNPMYEGIPNINGVVKEMNKRVRFVKATNEYILLEREQNEEGKLTDTWLLKKGKELIEYFDNETFTTYIEGRAKEIHPFTLFRKSKLRKEVYKIGFDPKNRRTDIFNLFRGFGITDTDCKYAEKSKCQPLLDHIKNIWCNGNEKSYNYIMNLFAHYIQKPHIKSGVMLCLKSKQGAGKGIVLEFLHKIIGEAHYCQNSNANSLFGNFNGVLEGKILVNLDEAFWGGDKALEGQVKNKVTEKKQYINKKNKEEYCVDDYSNYIITTNNDWFAGVDAGDRRHYCLELNNEYAGINTKRIKDYHKKVRDSCVMSFANILYTRDIEEFNPREFEKTPLLQDQVERNWNTAQSWFHQILLDGEFRNGDNLEYGGEHYRSNILKTKGEEKFLFYKKDWLFENYENGKYIKKKLEKNEFFKVLKNDCLGHLYKECKFGTGSSRTKCIHLPSIDIVREEWCNQQNFKYEFDEDEFNEDEFD